MKLAEWQLYGSDRKDNFEQELYPDSLAYTLERYQMELGEEFGIRELMELEKIRAMALIAEAVNDAPEFLVDQIGKALHESNFRAVPNALESIAEAISETT